ncbi:hemerythrin domain-containing protein [Dickeya oryzae]|uniref:hemerythrin domain-containing protein n=1 Tax=Dickeya oryzae TaxID=1240404 RepID=UPI001AECE003|nr:hemerythrin domain-containing protein [Dickeya oryzae]MBP2843956.1 hemerythrin domain-containing protein [Dickeya oryzae]
MDLDKFKHQHDEILSSISQLRYLAKAGVTQNAHSISNLIVKMSSVIKLHLAAEDSALYPALQQQPDAELTKISQFYQKEMQDIAAAYNAFSRRWNTAASLNNQDDAFRKDANHVLRMIYERMQRENSDFYPRIGFIK